MTDNEDRKNYEVYVHDESVSKSVQRGAIAVVLYSVILLAGLFIVQYVNWRQGQDIREILQEVEPSNLADSWEIVVVSDDGNNTFEIGEAVTLEGNFVCSEDALRENPDIFFESSMIPVVPGSSVEIGRTPFPSRSIEAICKEKGEFVPFTIPWTDEMIRIASESISEPTLYYAHFTVSAVTTGWSRGVADSGEFILVLPSNDDLDLPSETTTETGNVVEGVN